jgi:hypothetical protein
MNAALEIVRKLAACFLLFLFSLPHSARAGLEIGDGVLPPTDVSPHLSVFVDPTAALGIREVLVGEGIEFEPNLSLTPSFGFTRAAVWLKFEIRSVAEVEKTVRVEAATARISHFTWYVVANGRVLQTVNSGAADQGRHALPLPRIELPIPPGDTLTLYAKVRSNASLWLPLRIGSPEAMERDGFLHLSVKILKIGIAVTLSFICVILGILHRQNLYFHLAALAFSSAIYQGIFNGDLRMVWPEMPIWIERQAFGVNSALGSYFFMTFNRLFLRMKDAALSVRVPQGVAEFLCLLCAFAFLVLDYYDSVRLFNVLLILALLLSCLAIPLRVYQLRTAMEFWYLVTWLFYGLPLAVLCLTLSGMLPMIVSFSQPSHRSA